MDIKYEELKKYTYEELENIASNFHLKYITNPIKIPIDIEFIIEKYINLEIFPYPNIKLELDSNDIGALIRDLNKNRWIIYVDSNIAYNYENRYRFTLAEEYSH